MAAVWLTAPVLGLRLSALSGCTEAGQILEVVQRDTGLCDFYIVCNGRIVDRDEPLQNGSVYRLEPRLRGGKGGFGSMLRALGAQIEKTTNREACRDLSGRRLRDVNHEKEMADWLKKQSEREAEKEQRRLERLQKKLAEPKHHFTDSQYTQQCHELSERLEDSVIKGLQASSSSAVRPDTAKRPSEERDGPESKRSRGNFTWTGLDLDSDEDQDPDESESEDSGRSSSSPAPSEDQSTGARPSPGPSSRPGRGQTYTESSCGPERYQGESSPEEVQRKPESSCGPERDQGESSPEEVQRKPESSPEEVQRKPESSCGPERDQGESSPEEVQRKPESSCGPERDQGESSPEEVQRKPESSCGPERDQGESSPEEVQRKPESSSSPDQEETKEQRSQDLDLDLGLDLDSVSCAEDLEALGLNVLKEALMRRGLKCGGTLSERAARLFSVRGKRQGDFDPTLLAKSGKRKAKHN